MQIFDTTTGMKIGTTAPDKTVDYHSGWTDFPMCIRAMTLKDGKAIVFVEEDLATKVMIYQIKKASVGLGATQILLNQNRQLTIEN